MNDLNKKLAELSGEYSEGYFDKNPNNAPDYLNDWNELMPLAVKNDVEYVKNCMGTYSAISKDSDGWCNNLIVDECPQRAIILCLIAKFEGE